MSTRCGPVYFGDESKKIILNDTLAELKKLPSESIDLTFTDPPYSIGKDFSGVMEPWNEEAFLVWLLECVGEYRRVLKPHGTICVMNSTENMPYTDLRCRQPFTVRSRIVWPYDSSGVRAGNYFDSMCGPILMIIEDQKNYTFNHDDILVETKTGAKHALIDYRENPSQPYNQKKIPGNVWEFPCVRYLMDEYESHPTQKPKALLERIILTSSSPDDKTPDPFAGSFTTGATAVKLSRKFVGIEINTEYVKIGLRRLNIGSHFLEIELAKVKKRKTKGLSKKS